MKYIRKLLLVFTLSVLFASGAWAQGRLLFKTGFEKGTILETLNNGDAFSGRDQSTGFSWDSNDVPGTMRFVYIAGKDFNKYASTRLEKVKNHEGKRSTAVRMSVKKDYPDDKFGAVSRNEFSFFADSSFTEGYVSFWMKLQDNFLEIAPKTAKSEQLAYYNLDSWRMLMEVKEPSSGISIKGRGTNNYRTSFFIARDSLTNKMYWLLRAEMPQPVRKIDWSIENRNIEVPIGKWFKMEAYFKKGRDNGRVWWAVDGHEIADYRGRTEHPDNPLPVKFWSFFKLYQDEAWFEKGEVYQWVDDLEFWSTWPSKDCADEEKVIFRESFSYPDGELPAGWWSEGNAAKIKEGRLFVDADTDSFRASTVWLDREISGDVKVEFDVHVVSSSDTANNINCFFHYSDPGGKPLRETKHQRENGTYGHYHKLDGYIFTYLANGDPGNARLRFRDNPGFSLSAENFGSECKSGTTYHISIIKQGNRFQYWVNDKRLLDKVDDEYNPLHDKGIFGFRTWHTALWWDNLVITRLD